MGKGPGCTAWALSRLSGSDYEGDSPSASQAEVRGEGPLTKPPLSARASPLLTIGIRNFAAQAPHSCSAYSIGSLPGRYKVRYIGSLSVEASAPHEMQAKTFSLPSCACKVRSKECKFC
jgi:hypothetical protein